MRKSIIIANLNGKIDELRLENDNLQRQNTNLQRKANALEEEVKELAEKITAQTTDCNIGAWCNDCKHFGYGRAEYIKRNLGDFGMFVREECGVVRYCKKHLHDICKEFEHK